MKSFSAAGYAGEASELDWARQAVARDPQALFSDFQWFLFRSRNTVYFTAFSREAVTRDGLTSMVAEMVSLAPQLTHGFSGARPGEPFARHVLDAITSLETVDSFEGYPDAWLEPGQEVFAETTLPLFRVKAVTLRNGPDAEGRRSMILVRSSHALLEGSDSALLTRGQSAAHGQMRARANKVPLAHRLKYGAIAWLTTPLHMLGAHLLSPKEKPMGFRSLAFERDRLRRLAKAMNVRTRSLMFALVTHALNGTDGAIDKRVIAAAYTMLDTARTAVDDDFFRVRALDAKFRVLEDFEAYVRVLDDTIGAVEQKDITRTQYVLNATFKLHRRLAKLFPFLYGPRFWRYSGPYDLVLTLVPPHRPYGTMTREVVEPIYCGSFHPGTNLCTFVPGRRYVTFNFSMETRHIAQVDAVTALLERMEAQYAPA
jgi:hypothetical protein